jgi:hypothetical protein
VKDATFLIGVAHPVARAMRGKLEDRLLDEARSLIRKAESEERFDWEAHRFVRNPRFGVYEKILTVAELRLLLE